MTDETLLTVKQVAEYLQLHPRTVSNKARKGEIPARRVGGQWRFEPKAIREYNKAPDLDKEEITLLRGPFPTIFV